MTLAPTAPDEEIAGAAADGPGGEGATERAPDAASAPTPGGARGAEPTAPLAVAAVASLAAGVIHATATGVHGEHRSTAIAFGLLTVFQVAWGALALRRSARWLSLVGAAGNAVALGGWALAKTSGIGFIDGLEEAESVQFADGAAAALALIAVVGALAAIVRPVARTARGLGQPVVAGIAGVAAVALVLPAMVAAGNHSHAGGHHGEGGGHEHASQPTPPKPYDGTLPVDLSGVPGVSAEEQAEAEELVERTIRELPQFEDPAVAEARGYRSIGDGGTGHEHFVNWSLIDDDTQLDPSQPESLVYDTSSGERRLAAAMFMGRSGQPLEEFPGVGGDMIQSHIHNDLCYAGEEGAWVVADVAAPPEECRPGTSRLGDPAPMIHVWITEHRCGPFAALEGIGGGQVAPGEEHLCDHVHGTPAAAVGT